VEAPQRRKGRAILPSEFHKNGDLKKVSFLDENKIYLH
jgi:hypothetical protein